MEVAVALASGIAAHSLTLLAFGADSVIELISAGVLCDDSTSRCGARFLRRPSLGHDQAATSPRVARLFVPRRPGSGQPDDRVPELRSRLRALLNNVPPPAH